MESIFIEKTDKTPSVNFNAKEGLIELKGRAIPEEPKNFYTPLLQWIMEYAQNPHTHTTVHMELDYFSSSSLKWLLNLLKKLEPINESGKSIIVNWHYEEDDEDLMKTG